jgi:IclR family transcriptional regulator, mhp operon transcriptional activator
MRDYKVKTIESLSRGFEVVQLLQEVRAASLHDLHRMTGIPKSTLLRILATAHQHGLVWQRMVDGAFVPSHTLMPRLDVDTAEWLAELASPVMERLSRRVRWPSILSVPRLDYMETLETNSSKAYFDELPPRPRGLRINMLGSASGRAYLAYCPANERESVLQRLRQRDEPGHATATDPNEIRQLVESTRHRGYATRASFFGGDYNLPRRQSDDGRDSIALPIRLDERVLGCMNLTWRRDVHTVQEVVRLHLTDLRRAVGAVEAAVQHAGPELPVHRPAPEGRTESDT